MTRRIFEFLVLLSRVNIIGPWIHQGICFYRNVFRSKYNNLLSNWFIVFANIDQLHRSGILMNFIVLVGLKNSSKVQGVGVCQNTIHAVKTLCREYGYTSPISWISLTMMTLISPDIHQLNTINLTMSVFQVCLFRHRSSC